MVNGTQVGVAVIESNCFVNGYSDYLGGALLVFVDCRIKNSLFDRCIVGGHPESEGGAICVRGAALNLSFCTFAGCVSSQHGGGGISFSGTELRLEGTSFLLCVSSNDTNPLSVGGGLRLCSNGAYCRNCSFLNCHSYQYGGGIGQSGEDNSDHLLELEDCIFGSNVAQLDGGAINLFKVSLKVTNCGFFYNWALRNGGGIGQTLYYNITLINSIFIRNVVGDCGSRSGGALYLNISDQSPKFNILNTFFFRNEVEGQTCESFYSFFILMCAS
jgi:hypothetical protein